MAHENTFEEALLLGARLEQAAQSWQIHTNEPHITPYHSERWLTAYAPYGAEPSSGTINYKWNVFTHADLWRKHGMVVAGGYVAKFIRRCNGLHTCMDCDMDIFTIGNDCDDATTRVWACIGDLIARMGHPYTITHSEHVVQIQFENPNRYHVPNVYQFILRLYPSIAHVIGGFDLSVSQCAHDGTMIHMTTLGMESIKRNAVFVDVTRSSPSFRHRIRKYSAYYNIVFVGVRMELLHACIEQWDHAYAEFKKQRQLTHADAIANAKEHARRNVHNAIAHINSAFDTYVDYDLIINSVQPDLTDEEYASLRQLASRYYVQYGNQVRFEENCNVTIAVGDFRVGSDGKLVYKRGKPKSDYCHRTDWLGRTNTRLLNTCPEHVYQIYRYTEPTDPIDILSRAPVFIEPDDRIPAIVERLSQLRWMTKNPGRQWTASFDPQPITGPSYYGNMYTGNINNSLIALTMWLGWYFDHNCTLRCFPRDIMKMLIVYIQWARVYCHHMHV